MMNIKKCVAGNKLCTFISITVLGAAIGMVAAKAVVEHCCCASKIKNKAKKAIRAMEDKLFEQI